MHRLSILIAVPLALAACGRTDGNETATNIVVPDNGYTAKMAALNEGERNGVLFRAITDAERACQGVTRSQAIDPVQGRPAWVATCEGGEEWLVVLGEDGIATVTNARELAKAQGAAK
ncbi:hypothetical protein ASG29_02840 [Sphingomonas sp. Leaf412]|uniref:hypothetical protein n=1 Tax=Sphingomonas sp. Leaf412 TaxID=1736370 RepID=UPI0006FEB4E1|nr:hypothetical protein [Sphingomonas sp. Leaf412]KQT35080.1 hypothetical protein ASG29_02840 [Sphingomonas sp. Leaf412]